MFKYRKKYFSLKKDHEDLIDEFCLMQREMITSMADKIAMAHRIDSLEKNRGSSNIKYNGVTLSDN